MKRYQNRSKGKRQLFQAVLRKWNTKKYAAKPFSARNQLATAVLGATAVAGFGASAWAANEDPTLMPEVVVTGQQTAAKDYKPVKAASPKYTQSLLETPQSITVIPKSVMQDQGATSMRDVLKNVPGISIQAGEGGVPAGDNLSIRGFSARTDLFIDGVRDFGGYTRDPFNFEQIEVVKGPASTYAGRGSTGGSVNMVSKSPELDPSFSGTIGGGTDEYQRYTIDMNQPLQGENVKGVAVRLNAMWHDSEVSGRHIVDNNRWGVAPSITFGLETPTRVTLSYFRLEQDNTPDYGIPWVPLANVPLGAAYGDKPAPTSWENFYGLKDRDYEETTTDIGTIKVEHDFSEDLSLSNVTRYGETYRDSIITAPRFASNATSNVARTDWKSRDQLDTVFTNQTDVTVKFNTAELEHTFVPGLEISREEDINYTRLATGPNSSATGLANPNPDDAYTENIKRNGAYSQATSNSYAIYGFDNVKLNEQWEVNAGLRWDYFNVDYLTVAAPGTTTASNLGRIDRMLSWSTGLVYKPQENGSIYAAYGTSFNPSAEGLALSTATTNAANFNLDPEESRTIELGTKWELLEKRLAVNTAIFRTDKTNARTEDPGNPGDILVLDGEQRVDGFELGLTGAVTDKWNVTGAYTFLTSEVVKANNALLEGEELGNTPRNSFSLWTTYDLPFNFQVGGGLQFVDTRLNNTGSSRIAPEYWLGDAMLAYKVNKDVTLRLNAYNIADAEYIDRLGGGHFIPGAGRSATLTTEFKF